MPDLSDSHGEDMTKLIEAAGAAGADMTALEAVAEYMATVYEDTRTVKYQRGFPLETIYGVPGGHGKTHYQLVVNCTDLLPEEQDEIGMHAKGPQVTVSPFCEEPKTAILYIGHLESAIRHFHDLPEGTPVLRCGQTQLRWYAEKVAEFHLTFEKSEYAITALATSLVHLPLHCVPLGSDDFQLTDVCIPRVRVFHPRQTRTGNAERQLHVISEQLRGHTTKDLEKQLRTMGFIESAIKGARGLPAYMEKIANSIRLVAVTEEAANDIESKALAFPGLTEYSVQRIRPSLANRNEDETEIIVVDKGSSINVTTDLPDLVRAIRELFTQAGLGEEDEHLKLLPVTTHSDFLRTGDKFKGKRRHAAPSAWGTGQTEAVVQALEDKLTSQWANVVKGGSTGDGEILRLRNAVEKLEDTCKNGFKESVQATNQVSDKVDEVNACVIDLTDETHTFNTKHLGIAGEILESFSNSNKALAKLLKGHHTPEPTKKVLRRPREATSDSEASMEIEENRAELRRLQRARDKSDERKKLEEPRTGRSHCTKT
ncbi:hypothetical protein CYMTET_3204 [Cymbomonas tetramitiformis]|uniref:Uncharacterized protein n=1 Tax=Cymbomonas tetramitiformis TaxID=36881 RepID=A0AAE0LLB7_9CHLO|nr:hypothetical protein CYMTET_3204 [Cymbomonas tetramitiformis]